MQKIKFTALVSGFLVSLAFIGAASVKAATPILSIQTLPSYVNKTDFKISCTSNGEKAQFYVAKNGGADVAFGPSIDLATTPCQVQVINLQLNEEASYKFTVKLNTGETSSTATIFDNSGPSPVSGYYKDGVSGGYRLHYHTPNDTDFDKVVIYRGDTPDFQADSAHEIATVNCSRDSDMTYEDHSGDNKYYNIRALDHAGNSSALTGDGGGVITTVTSATPGPAGTVTAFPKEAGSILGSEDTENITTESTLEPTVVEKINTFAGTTSGPIKWILTHKKISIGLVIIVLLLVWRLRQSKGNSN